MQFSNLQALAGLFALIEATNLGFQHEAFPLAPRQSSSSSSSSSSSFSSSSGSSSSSSSSSSNSPGAASSLWVTEVPTAPRPYAVRHYGIDGLAIGAQVYRFPVTGPSSDYAFTLISTAAPASGYLGVLPHVHQTHYENFFCLKGRLQLWTADADTFAHEEARVLTPGDFGAVPHNTTHTFQIQDP